MAGVNTSIVDIAEKYSIGYKGGWKDDCNIGYGKNTIVTEAYGKDTKRRNMDSINYHYGKSTEGETKNGTRKAVCGKTARTV